MTDAQVTIEPTNEVADLFAGDTSLDNELAAMQEAEKELPPIESDSNQQQEAESNDDKQAGGEQETQTEAQDEEYKPEEYQHNKNYKAAMEAERREKAELKKQFSQTREENEKLKQMFDKILKNANEQSAQVDQPKIVSYEEDPIEHLRQRAELAEKQLQEFSKDKQTNIQQAQQQQAMQKFIGTYQQQAANFAKGTPDFQDAYNFALKSRLEEYETFGYSKEQATAMANEDEMAIVANCLQNGVNPAEKIYQFAKMRGYQGNQPVKQEKPNNIQKLETIERGLQASKSVNQGGVKPSELTLEAIYAMDDDEFDKVDWKKVLKMG